jgi:predicted transglutaminase-like cysteine proteinase
MRGAHAARALLVLISCCCGNLAAAGPGDGVVRTLAEHEAANMPRGMANLCTRLPSICAIHVASSHRHTVRLADHGALLAQVNRAINHRIASTTDRQLYGRDEYWALPTTAGDCEDYVLLKRQTLLALGFAETSLLITVVHDENGEGHAVLTIPTTEGDVVLDNRRDDILPWWNTGYAFIKRQSEADPVKWVSLGPERLQATNIASGPGLP